MLPQTRLGSYNASHLWGGLWASIDGGKEGSRGETLRGQREKEEGAGEVGRDQGGSTLAHEFHPFSPKIKCPNKCCGYKGQNLENLQPSIGCLAQLIKSISSPPPHPSTLHHHLYPVFSFTNFQFTPSSHTRKHNQNTTLLLPLLEP